MDVNTLFKTCSRKGRTRLDWDGRKIYKAVAPVSPYYRKTTFVVFKNGHKKELGDYASYPYAKKLMDLGYSCSVPRVDYDYIIEVLAILPKTEVKNIVAVIQKYEQKRFINEDEDVLLNVPPTYIITPINSVVEEKIAIKREKFNALLREEFREKLQSSLPALPAPAVRHRIGDIFRRFLLRLARA